MKPVTSSRGEAIFSKHLENVSHETLTISGLHPV